ncbi:hypothetical protein BD310DRAFT_883148 [Dichomitus squalens]|uniref:Transmembrane protein n=1 Tax=Dichomitus squalens TaxID=114155 RepID=A0A4Q9PPT0_9APHY|nr:hypothetical protein BD310DRAFT_883148 [Dichomitus squalens]
MPHVLSLDGARLAVRAPQASAAESSVRPTTAPGSLTDIASIATSSIPPSGNGEVSFTGTPTQLVESPPALSPSGASTFDTPFFPTPTQTQAPGDGQSLGRTKIAVEGALVVVAAALIILLSLWRVVRIRRSGRPMRDFFVAHPQPDVPPRPRAVPRTTGLPPAPAPPVGVIYDSLTPPVPLVHRGAYERRTRRVRAGDVDAGGRRGHVAHPDDPDEFLPEYDDKDVLPRYQDVQRAHPAVGVGAGGHAPNGVGEGAGEAGDTVPLVTRMQLSSSASLEDTRGLSSVGSHEGHETEDGTRDPQWQMQ